MPPRSGSVPLAVPASFRHAASCRRTRKAVPLALPTTPGRSACAVGVAAPAVRFRRPSRERCRSGAAVDQCVSAFCRAFFHCLAVVAAPVPPFGGPFRHVDEAMPDAVPPVPLDEVSRAGPVPPCRTGPGRAFRRSAGRRERDAGTRTTWTTRAAGLVGPPETRDEDAEGAGPWPRRPGRRRTSRGRALIRHAVNIFATRTGENEAGGGPAVTLGTRDAGAAPGRPGHHQRHSHGRRP